MILPEEVLKKALKEVNYKKIIKVMKSLNWEWRDHFPDENEMRNVITELFYSALLNGYKENEDSYNAETGGFRVKVFRYKDDKGENQFGCRIDFILDSVDECTDENY